MNSNTQFPIDISIEEVEAISNTGALKQLFSQFIFILDGSGTIDTDQHKTHYQSGDVFFFRKNKTFEIQTQSTTRFYQLSITEQARLTLKDLVENSNGKALRLAKAQSASIPKIILKEPDQKMLKQLFDLMLKLHESYAENENILYFQCISLINIIERNVSFNNADPRPVQKPKINFILRHIHKNLTKPDLLSLTFIANKYNLTPNQLGKYFKAEMKQSVKQYIMEYRMSEIGKKVKSGSQSFSEIAHQYGFTDENHFYKAFKKYYKKGTVYKNKLKD